MTRERTRLLRAGTGKRDIPHTVSPPVQRGSTVLLSKAAALYDHSKPTYGRAGLSTQGALADAIAELEGATTTKLFPSGLAAVTGTLLALLKAGDELLAADCVYAPTRRFCDSVLKRFGVAVRYFPGDAAPDAILAMAGPTTRAILMESPGSLTFEIQDVPGVASLARERDILTILDNTWAAGLLFKPLAHGADVSVQALTKYVGGHSDVFMGSASTARPDLAEALDHAIWDFGWSVSPDDAFLVLRGLRTLSTRMAAHGENAMRVALWLREQPEVAQVLYPPLPGAPGHALWARDFSGGAGLMGVALNPAKQKDVHALLDALTLFGLGFSWGGYESLAIHADPQLRRLRRSLPGPLLRLHIGLEDPDDLIADLRRGLDALPQP